MGRPRLGIEEKEDWRRRMSSDLGPVVRLMPMRQWCATNGRKREPDFIVRDDRCKVGRGLIWLGNPDADTGEKEAAVKSFLDRERRQQEGRKAIRAAQDYNRRLLRDWYANSGLIWLDNPDANTCEEKAAFKSFLEREKREQEGRKTILAAQDYKSRSFRKSRDLYVNSEQQELLRSFLEFALARNQSGHRVRVSKWAVITGYQIPS